MRGDLGDPVHPRRPAPRHLQQLPPVLHREAEAARHAGAHRPVPEEVCEYAGEAGEGEEGSRAGEGREEVAGEREEGEGREERAGREGLTSWRSGWLSCWCRARAGPRFRARSRARARNRARKRGPAQAPVFQKNEGPPLDGTALLFTGARGGSSGHPGNFVYFSRDATAARPSSSRSTRSRPWLARRPSRFILLISVETNDRDAPTRSARSCCVMPCRQSSLPGGTRSPWACASACSISAS